MLVSLKVKQCHAHFSSQCKWVRDEKPSEVLQGVPMEKLLCKLVRCPKYEFFGVTGEIHP